MSASVSRTDRPAAVNAAHKSRPRSQRRKAALALLAFMSGGSLMGCETLLKEAAMDTTRQYILGLLDPVAIASSMVGEDIVDSGE